MILRFEWLISFHMLRFEQNRVSSTISNAPLVLNVDCDMYSNNSKALLDAICFFLDPEKGNKIGYVQFPQSFNRVTTNDLYSNGVKRIYEVCLRSHLPLQTHVYMHTNNETVTMVV